MECAPWQGGIWERLVASVKRCMKKVIGIKTLTYIELQTIVAEIEQILNNRPIGADYEDDHEDVITPNHLVNGRRLETRSEGIIKVNCGDNDNRLVKRKRFIDTMLDHFWGRWRKEYLVYLRESQRPSSNGHSAIAKVNDVVVVYDEKAPRHLCSIGKITKLVISNDGKTRGAESRLGERKR